MLWEQILSMETSSSIAKGTTQCLHFEILVMKDLLGSSATGKTADAAYVLAG